MGLGTHFTRIVRCPARRIAHGSSLALLLVPNISAHAQSRISSTPVDWPSYGGDYTNQRYSALSGINRDNVARLVPRGRSSNRHRAGPLP